MERRPRHPTERPIDRPTRREPQIWRVPLDGPVTPRLQSKPLKEAIGFKVDLCKSDDE